MAHSHGFYRLFKGLILLGGAYSLFNLILLVVLGIPIALAIIAFYLLWWAAYVPYAAFRVHTGTPIPPSYRPRWLGQPSTTIPQRVQSSYRQVTESRQRAARRYAEDQLRLEVRAMRRNKGQPIS